MTGDGGAPPGDTIRRADAPAKLNLLLHVGARRPDGYHALESLVVFPAFGDRLSLDRAPEFSLTRTGPFAAALPEQPAADLVVRAVDGMAAIAARPPAFAMALEKNIPVAAGLGGGSADAAAAIRLVCGAWGIDAADPAVAALAEELGADVPMCLYGGPAWVGGIGARVTPIDRLPGLHLLLVNPGVSLSTGAVFAAFKPSAGIGDPPPSDADIASPESLLAYLARRRNDLAGPATELCPPIAEVLAALEGLAGSRLARMSGSGPTCFAVFESAGACAAAARDLRARHAGWWVRPTRTGHAAA